jgi:tetratricopeptide (TPR) repeat protein
MRGWTGALIAGSLLLAARWAWSLPSDSLPTPSASSAGQGPAHDAAAVAVYNAGVALLKRADQLDAAAAGQAGEARARTEKSARAAYGEARGKFQEATQRDPSLPEAWNNLGYARRKLGDYEAALAAYARALALRPDYPEALEYRGEAYLRMNRIEAAKQAYLDLFVTDRAVAKHFLASMQDWIAAEKGKPGTDAGALAALENWVQERSQIAGQTAALTREGTAANWR